MDLLEYRDRALDGIAAVLAQLRRLHNGFGLFGNNRQPVLLAMPQERGNGHFSACRGIAFQTGRILLIGFLRIVYGRILADSMEPFPTGFSILISNGKANGAPLLVAAGNVDLAALNLFKYVIQVV